MGGSNLCKKQRKKLVGRPRRVGKERERGREGGREIKEILKILLNSLKFIYDQKVKLLWSFWINISLGRKINKLHNKRSNIDIFLLFWKRKQIYIYTKYLGLKIRINQFQKLKILFEKLQNQSNPIQTNKKRNKMFVHFFWFFSVSQFVI